MPQWENGVQFPSEKPNWYHSTWHSQADFTQIIALGLTPEPSMKRFSLVLSFYMGGDLQLKEVKYQQSKPQSVAETGFNAGPPVHISTLSHSLYLTHALDFPCAPGLGQIHGITGFLNVEANWNYRKKQEIQNIPHVFLPPPNHSCICFQIVFVARVVQ